MSGIRRAALRAVPALALSLGVGAGGCGRRGLPLPPLVVEPEPPRLLPLRQEGGEISIRWYAPRLASDGSVEDLRLRKAIVSYRVVDVHRLAAEERAAQRAESEDGEEEESGDTPSGDEVPIEPAEPEPAEPEPSEGAVVEETPPDPGAREEPGSGEAAPTVPPAAEPAAPPGPTAEEGAATQEEAPPVPEEPEDTASGEESAAVEEPTPAPESPAPESREQESREQGEEPDPGETDQAAAEEPAGEDAPTEEAAEPAEPPPEPEPVGILLEYDELEFEVLSEVESEVLGEERVLDLPVDPEWVGRRLEITMRYESGGGPSEETEMQSLDVTGLLPAVEEAAIDIGPQALTVRWLDSRPHLETASGLVDPVFEVFRRRGAEPERLGRSRGPTLADTEVIWGEEVCYTVRVVLAGADDERVLADPGPGTPGAPDGEAGDDPQTAAPRGTENSEGEPGAALPDAPESGETPWSPIPIRVPGAGSSALSVGPMSPETCVTPVDVFLPAPPSDLRLFWRAERTELSWRESVSADVEGYHIYRSGPDGSGFERLTLAPVEETTFGDAARDPRGRYRYAVTAVDGAEPPNESLPSESRTVSPR